MPPPRDPQHARLDDIFVVETQRKDRRPAGGRQANDVRAAIRPGKMLGPDLRAGIEQRNQFSGSRIAVVGIGAFVLIATIASGAEIIRAVGATECLRVDVIYDQRHPDHAA